MNKRHMVDNVRFLNESLSLNVDGRTLEFLLAEISPLLANATRQQRETFDVSPGGYGLHWPLLNEDLSIDGLLSTFSTTGTESPHRRAG